jgi:hypothetical protein
MYERGTHARPNGGAARTHRGVAGLRLRHHHGDRNCPMRNPARACCNTDVRNRPISQFTRSIRVRSSGTRLSASEKELMSPRFFAKRLFSKTPVQQNNMGTCIWNGRQHNDGLIKPYRDDVVDPMRDDSYLKMMKSEIASKMIQPAFYELLLRHDGQFSGCTISCGQCVPTLRTYCSGPR